MNNITYKSKNREYLFMRKELLRSIDKVLRSEELVEESTSGKYPEILRQFEINFASYLGIDKALGTNSCTTALYLALNALGVGEGDKVILPVNTYIATALAVHYSGATPIFVDVEAETHNIDVEQIKKSSFKNAKAIVAVHLHGLPAELDKLSSLAKLHNLYLIEDCAQAHGASYNGKRVGTFGTFGCFSFFDSKNLGAPGDGGMIVSNDIKLMDGIDLLRENTGKRTGETLLDNKRFPSRLSSLHAAILDVKLKHLDYFNQKRNQIAQTYNRLIKSSNITLPAHYKRHAYFSYVIMHEKRDALREHLLKKGIACTIEYDKPLHLESAFGHLNYNKGDFPIAEELAKRKLSIPMNPFLEKEEIHYIAKTINEFP